MADQLRDLLVEGATLADAARLLSVSRSVLHRLANEHAMKRRRRAMPAAKRARIQRLLDEGRTSISRIARDCGVSKSTVSKMANAELNAAPGFKPRRLRKARFCPNCRYSVWLWPCVACYARESRTDPSPL